MVVQVEKSVTIDATPATAWSVLADFGAIATWVPLIGHSCLLGESSEGVGATRRVQIARQVLVERVVAWEPGRTLAYDIEGLPPIVGSPRNTWTLSPNNEGTLVALTTTINTGRNPVKKFAAGKALERMALASDMMLAGLASRSASISSKEATS
ncbi:MAG: SRPBCC family protein [Actinomycetota bacterium]|nr:SRPBCC family protein [Actinomycetota bacterium]MDA2972707.1 SRPBCC family protein [Actinomycetota bacterium]MDA3002187.1 SRPBCC family protein [Actinomycetota bacterium]